MYPSSKSKKKKKAHIESRGGQRFRMMEMGDDSQSDLDEAVGGYDPIVRRILAKAEIIGDKSVRRMSPGKDHTDESEDGDSDGDSKSEDSSYLHSVASSTGVDD